MHRLTHALSCAGIAAKKNIAPQRRTVDEPFFPEDHTSNFYDNFDKEDLLD